jgi:hypothetical protein
MLRTPISCSEITIERAVVTTGFFVTWRSFSFRAASPAGPEMKPAAVQP